MDEISRKMNEVSDNINVTMGKGNDIGSSMENVTDINGRVEGLVAKAERMLE